MPPIRIPCECQLIPIYSWADAKEEKAYFLTSVGPQEVVYELGSLCSWKFKHKILYPGGKMIFWISMKKIGNSSRSLTAWLLCKLLKMGRATSMCKSHSMQRLHFKKCLASCYHLEITGTGWFCNNPTWRSGNSWSLFLVVNKFSVDCKRSPLFCKGMKRLSSPDGAEKLLHSHRL